MRSNNSGDDSADGARVLFGGREEAGAFVGGQVLARAVLKQITLHVLPLTHEKGDRGRVAWVLVSVIRLGKSGSSRLG
jgi:hypothetical protein